MKFKLFLIFFIGILAIPYFIFSINEINLSKIKLISYQFAVEGFASLKNSYQNQDHQNEELILNEKIIKKELAIICFKHFQNEVTDMEFNKMLQQAEGELREQVAKRISYNSILFLTLEYPDYFGDLSYLVTEKDIENKLTQIIKRILNENLFINKER